MRESEEGHPIDAAVDRVVQHQAARRMLVNFHDQVRAALKNNEKGTKAFLALEELRHEMADEREQAYFNLGYEHGVADKHARERRSGVTLSEEAKQLAVEMRERLVLKKLPSWQALLCLLECAWSVAATESGRAKS